MPNTNNGERVNCGEAEMSMCGQKQQVIQETEGIVPEDNRLGPIRENIPVGSQVRRSTAVFKMIHRLGEEDLSRVQA